MAINFDSLPDSKPVSMVQPGTYYATIESAEMKKGKDASKPPYLNIKYKLTDVNGKSAGTLFDIFAESEAGLIRYKLKRFLDALGLDFQGEFELSDIQKVCTGKKIILDTKIEEGKEGRQDRAVVDLFTNEIYYNLNQAKEVFGETAVADSTSSNIINAADAEDANPSEELVEDDF